MTSLEIAELTGKQHFHVMEAIRKMEPAWKKVCKSNFRLTSRTIVQPNGGTREVPCYVLTKTECLYIATKFNDEARARLVLRWQELELQEQQRRQQLCLPSLYPRKHRELLRAIVAVRTGISFYKVDLKALDAAYSITFPKSTPINVNKKRKDDVTKRNQGLRG